MSSKDQPVAVKGRNNKRVSEVADVKPKNGKTKRQRSTSTSPSKSTSSSSFVAGTTEFTKSTRSRSSVGRTSIISEASSDASFPGHTQVTSYTVPSANLMLKRSSVEDNPEPTAKKKRKKSKQSKVRGEPSNSGADDADDKQQQQVGPTTADKQASKRKVAKAIAVGRKSSPKSQSSLTTAATKPAKKQRKPKKSKNAAQSTLATDTSEPADDPEAAPLSQASKKSTPLKAKASEVAPRAKIGRKRAQTEQPPPEGTSEGASSPGATVRALTSTKAAKKSRKGKRLQTQEQPPEEISEGASSSGATQRASSSGAIKRATTSGATQRASSSRATKRASSLAPVARVGLRDRSKLIKNNLKSLELKVIRKKLARLPVKIPAKDYVVEHDLGVVDRIVNHFSSKKIGVDTCLVNYDPSPRHMINWVLKTQEFLERHQAKYDAFLRRKGNRRKISNAARNKYIKEIQERFGTKTAKDDYKFANEKHADYDPEYNDPDGGYIDAIIDEEHTTDDDGTRVSYVCVMWSQKHEPTQDVLEAWPDIVEIFLNKNEKTKDDHMSKKLRKRYEKLLEDVTSRPVDPALLAYDDDDDDDESDVDDDDESDVDDDDEADVDDDDEPDNDDDESDDESDESDDDDTQTDAHEAVVAEVVAAISSSVSTPKSATGSGVVARTKAVIYFSEAVANPTATRVLVEAHQANRKQPMDGNSGQLVDCGSSPSATRNGDAATGSESAASSKDVKHNSDPVANPIATSATTEAVQTNRKQPMDGSSGQLVERSPSATLNGGAATGSESAASSKDVKHISDSVVNPTATSVTVEAAQANRKQQMAGTSGVLVESTGRTPSVTRNGIAATGPFAVTPTKAIHISDPGVYPNKVNAFVQSELTKAKQANAEARSQIAESIASVQASIDSFNQTIARTGSSLVFGNRTPSATRNGGAATGSVSTASSKAVKPISHSVANPTSTRAAAEASQANLKQPKAGTGAQLAAGGSNTQRSQNGGAPTGTLKSSPAIVKNLTAGHTVGTRTQVSKEVREVANPREGREASTANHAATTTTTPTIVEPDAGSSAQLAASKHAAPALQIGATPTAARGAADGHPVLVSPIADVQHVAGSSGSNPDFDTLFSDLRTEADAHARNSAASKSGVHYKLTKARGQDANSGVLRQDSLVTNSALASAFPVVAVRVDQRLDDEKGDEVDDAEDGGEDEGRGNEKELAPENNEIAAVADGQPSAGAGVPPAAVREDEEDVEDEELPLDLENIDITKMSESQLKRIPQHILIQKVLLMNRKVPPKVE